MTLATPMTNPISPVIMVGTENRAMSKISIALASDGGFEVEIPSSVVEGSHHVHIPASVAGLGILRKLLQERARQERHTIGMNGSPTQAQVEAWLAEERRERETKPKEVPELLANLDIESLDL